MSALQHSAGKLTVIGDPSPTPILQVGEIREIVAGVGDVWEITELRKIPCEGREESHVKSSRERTPLNVQRQDSREPDIIHK